MKLNRILTALTPVAIVGTIVPTVVSCGCSQPSITINYKDNINCFDKSNKDVKYYSLKTVQSGIKLKVNVHDRDQIDVEDINRLIAEFDETTIQNIYYDLIASLTILSGTGILFQNYQPSDTSPLNIQFKLNGEDKTLNNVQYFKKEGKIWFGSEGSNEYQSYIYKDCTPA